MARLFQPFQGWKPRASLCPALATWFFFFSLHPRTCLYLIECSHRGLHFYPIVPIWIQQCWFVSPGNATQLLWSDFTQSSCLLFFQVKGSWWNGKHCGGPLERASWGGVSKAGVEAWAISALHWVPLIETWRPFFQGSPVLNRLSVEVLWCMQMLICIILKNKLLQC